MEKIKLNALVNIALIMLFFILAFTGITLGHIFPERSNSLDDKELLDDFVFLHMDRYDWADIHDNLGELVLILISIHIILHSAYIKNLPRLIKRNTYTKTETLNKSDRER